MRVLVVEDERRLANIVKRGLVEEGYAVDNAFDGEEGAFMAETTAFDLIILDIMLPKKDGVMVCQELREKKINVPILILTARDSIEDRVKGLDAGADDYLVKPFAFRELMARIRALLRREVSSKSADLEVGDLIMNTVNREVKKGDKPIELTAKEYAILEYLMRHPTMLVTRAMIEENIWNYEFEGSSNIIEVFVGRLRNKIDKEGENSFIQTVRGAGYRLKSA